MRIYFENHPYASDLIKPYLDGYIKYSGNPSENKWSTDRIGYIFVNTPKEATPVFILPKSFLTTKDGKMLVLGMENVHPEEVIDTESESNPLELTGLGYFLPELGIWLYRALCRFRFENIGTIISEQAQLDSLLPEDNSADKDFLSTALELIDFLKDHQTLFTQISLINHSGRNKIDWPKTVKGDSFFEDGEPWYPEPAIKEKAINIDDTLIIIYYSVLKYLRDKYRFPIEIGEVPYQLLGTIEVQRLIDTGIGSKQLQIIRHKYYRDDLKHLWGLLNTFFKLNAPDQEKTRDKEHLLVKDFEIIFEAMIDALISDKKGVEKLKNQKDGKLIDHIYKDKSLIDTTTEIYYIGDSKYYADQNDVKDTAYYKQFTYAKNAIQYHIDNINLKGKETLGQLRYRDTQTEGYNVTPNFFIRPKIKTENLNYDKPSLEWSGKSLEPNIQFKDRLFDRDTLLLREYHINLLFTIAAYASYENWATTLHTAIRKDMIDFLNQTYIFFRIEPKPIPYYSDPKGENKLGEIPFMDYHRTRLQGRAYKVSDQDTSILLAFEKNTPEGDDDLKDARANLPTSIADPDSITTPYKLEP